jgi:hypothetical protein
MGEALEVAARRRVERMATKIISKVRGLLEKRVRAVFENVVYREVTIGEREKREERGRWEG